MSNKLWISDSLVQTRPELDKNWPIGSISKYFCIFTWILLCIAFTRSIGNFNFDKKNPTTLKKNHKYVWVWLKSFEISKRNLTQNFSLYYIQSDPLPFCSLFSILKTAENISGTLVFLIHPPTSIINDIDSQLFLPFSRLWMLWGG